MMNEVKRLVDQLRRAFEGGSWHGPSVREVLHEVDSRIASRRPIQNAHTIWEIVHHIDSWHRDVLRQINGEVVTMTTEQDWPQVSAMNEENWKTDLRALEESYQALREAAGALKDEQLQQKIPGTDDDYYFVLHGLIHHDLFHAGQIALLKK